MESPLMSRKGLTVEKKTLIIADAFIRNQLGL
jgi:hypothetical protein